MSRLFLTVLNMSIGASFCILAVILLRLCLMRAPKIFSYLLWAVVVVRLISPVLPEADFGLMPELSLTKDGFLKIGVTTSHEYYAMEEDMQEDLSEGIHGGHVAGVDSNAGAMDEVPAQATAKAGEEVIYLPEEMVRTTDRAIHISEVGLAILTAIWICVALGLISYAAVGYGVFLHRIKKKEIVTPFVAGLIHPSVYLPEGLDEMQRQLVQEHEMIHIRRLDYLVKPFLFLLCCVHWFNPLVWLFFFLMERDMEASCDEAVIRKIGYDRRKDYANTLLGLSQSRGWKAGYPIAFGENHVKSRIKGVIKMKKTGIGVCVAAVALLLGAAVLLLVNRPQGNVPEPETVVPVEEEAEAILVMPNETVTEKELPGESTFSLPDIQENVYFYSEDFLPDSNQTELPSSSVEDQETIMNYDPSRARDQFEVLNLPQIDEAFQGSEILFSYPVEGARISDSFGSRVHPVSGDILLHLGIDFAAEAGTPVRAAADGTVVKTDFDSDSGNYLILLHENGDTTYYSHCQDILAEEGQKVKCGEQIATVGNTGKSTGPHLHFGVSRNGDYIEPEFVEDGEG